MSRKLDIYIDTTVCGQLSEINNIWSFQYLQDWLNSPSAHPLSPNIPLIKGIQTDGSTVRHIQWFFDNLLPEETARQLLAKDLKEPIDDAFALLTKAGAESAGAITLLPHNEPIPAGQSHALSYGEISQRIQALPEIPLNRSERKRMSLAGAQHKMLVIYQDDNLYEPSGQMPSTHLLKPEHSSPDIYYQTPRNEWFCMTLARLCGFDVPDVDVLYMPEPVYLVKRFDRVGHYPNQARLHTLDGCQTLGLPALSKYTNSTSKYLLQLIHQTREKAATTLNVFRWACFNALVGNGDAHLKNISFFMRRNTVRMTPLYDLVCTAIYEPTGRHMDHLLSYPMGAAKRMSDLTRQDVLTFGGELGVPAKLASREIDKLTKALLTDSKKLLDSVEALPPYNSQAGELRMLREIYYNCIEEMCQQVAP